MHAQVPLNQANGVLNAAHAKKHVFHLNFILKATAELARLLLLRQGGAEKNPLARLLSTQNKAASANDD